MLVPAIGSNPSIPFTVGDIKPSKGFVHVLDDVTLEVLLKTLDTISDLTNYLTAKERLIRRGQLLSAAGDDDLLAYYLELGDENKRATFDAPPDETRIVVDEGHWEAFIKSEQWAAKQKADRISYSWDSLIQAFNHHLLEGDQEYASHPGVADQEMGLRLLAREPRVRRRMLGTAFIRLLEKTQSNALGARVVAPSHDGDPYYVFVLVPSSWDKGGGYRETRRKVLLSYARVAKLLHPDASDVVGIATESGHGANRSEDFLVYDGREWPAEEKAEAERLHEAGLLKKVREQRSLFHEFPVQLPKAGRGGMPKIGRNEPCPCGSGRKYKKCCLS